MRPTALHAVRRPGGLAAEKWQRAALYAVRAWDADTAELPAQGGGRHPFAEGAISASLRRRAEEIDAAFNAIEPVLRELAPEQFDRDFPQRASARLAARLQLNIAQDALKAEWTSPLDFGALHARCVIGTFCRLVERAFDRGLAQLTDGEDAATLIQRWGFHAIDITPCADGRLSGVIDYILRVPPSVVAYRTSYAGAMFDVADSVRHWESIELRRWREGKPNAADAPTRFLKIGVYHFSSADPHHEGCAAHGSDDARASASLLERLDQFAEAIRRLHGDAAPVATLLVGVDTDTDAIRVHVPDASGRMDINRFADNRALYARTQALAREDAKEAVREAVARCAGVAADDPATEGMRWFCGYLLKNNLAQVDAVRDWHGGHYQDAGHTERLIVVGDAVDDVQLRNLAFQAQMTTVEEGAADLDVGIKILGHLHEPRGLAVPVLVHFRAEPRIPGDADRARLQARRLSAAILARHAGLAASGMLHVQAVVREGDGANLQNVVLAQDVSVSERHA